MRWWGLAKLAYAFKRMHMSSRPISIEDIRPRTQQVDDKPDGFWYACGTEWIDYVNMEYQSGRGDYLYEVSLEESRMLRITNESEFDNFEAEYGVEIKYPRMTQLEIDWPQVAERHGGIEICPLIRSRRRRPWYWSWSIASGCVWAPGTITGLEEFKSSSVEDKPEGE